MRILWAGPPTTMENGRRLPQAQRARLSESFTIVLLALLQPSADPVSDTELPKSGSGKILKQILRERFWVDQKRAVS